MTRSWDETPRTLFITSNQPDICTMWRVWWVASELAARGYIADYCTFGDINTYIGALNYGRYNTIVTPRMFFDSLDAENQWLSLIHAFSSKVKWWYDTDDDLFDEKFVDRMLATHVWDNPGKAERQLEFFRKSRIRLLEQADGITVASPKLIETVGGLTSKPIALVHNGLNAALYEHVISTSTRQIEPITVGWSGGPRLEGDLEPLYEAWARLAELNKDVQFVLQGWAPEKMKTCVPADRIHLLEGVPVEQYPGILTNIDIFCCVAPPDKFSESKTPIKFFEATIAGSTCVVSPTLYGPVVQDRITGVVANSVDDWVAYLNTLVSSPEIRQRMNTMGRKDVLANHTLSNTYTEWLDAWAFLVS